MKTIKQIKEDYDNRFLNQVEYLPEEVMLEGKDTMSKFSPSKDMPMMILFRRIQYRMFPNRQIVGLYYSKILNKYLSIPFGPSGNLNLSEAVVIEPEMLDEDWQKVNRRDKTAGLSQAAVNAYRRENPGSKLQTAVTEKNPSGKRAARRRSFCKRMGGMKKRLTSAKTANDPDSNINKALRRWRCEESFYTKLHEKRQERLDEVLPFVAAAGEALTGLAARGLAAAGAGAVAKQVAKRGVVKTAKVLTRAGKSSIKKMAKSAGKWALDKAMTPDDSKQQQQQQAPAAEKPSGVFKIETPYGKTKAFSSSELSKGRAGDTTKSIESQAAKRYAQSSLKSPSQQQENSIADIRKMIDEGYNIIELPINGKSIMLNNNMAKRIVEVYDSVNVKNKKIVEGMLNEDLESFKKLLNFSIKV